MILQESPGRLSEAESVYRETIERFPRDPVARTGLAEVLKSTGRLDEAESVYRETLMQFPHNVVARVGLAEVLKAEDRLYEAEAIYRSAVELFPDNVIARNGLADVLVRLARGEAVAAPASEGDSFLYAAPNSFYSNGNSQETKEISTLITSVNSLLVDRIAKDPQELFALTPREFEEFTAQILSGFGYVVELTARTRDGGRDIIAVRRSSVETSRLLVECKRYARDRWVGVSHVRELYGVRALERATKAILATTSYFSPEARSIESRVFYELELKDFQDVTQWAREYMRLQKEYRTDEAHDSLSRKGI